MFSVRMTLLASDGGTEGRKDGVATVGHSSSAPDGGLRGANNCLYCHVDRMLRTCP